MKTIGLLSKAWFLILAILSIGLWCGRLESEVSSISKERTGLLESIKEVESDTKNLIRAVGRIEGKLSTRDKMIPCVDED
jgi:hypothetical protein